MSARVLLISINTCAAPDPVFPLGICYVGAALRAAGHTVALFDMLSSPEPLDRVLDSFQPGFVGISVRNIDDVQIRKRETFFGSLPELCALVRARSQAKIVLGGAGFSIFPQQLLSFSTADFGIHGAGEDSLKALIAAVQTGADLGSIPNLLWWRDRCIVMNPGTCGGKPAATAGEQADLPDLAHARDGIAQFYVGATGLLNVQTQRGCSHTCCYCTYPVIEGIGHRARPTGRVAAE